VKEVKSGCTITLRHKSLTTPTRKKSFAGSESRQKGSGESESSRNNKHKMMRLKTSREIEGIE